MKKNFEKRIVDWVNKEAINKLKKYIKWIWGVIVVIATLSGLYGCSIKDSLYDWQAIAEEYNNDGLELYNSSKYAEAIELYDKAISLESKGIDDIDICYYNRGRAYYKLGDYNHAIGDLTNAININKKSKYYKERGFIYETMGETEKAIADYSRALLD